MASKFRAVPWKRNLKAVPDHILKQIAAFQSHIFFVGVTKTFTPDQINAEPLKQLGIPSGEGESRETIPGADMGKYSDRNRNGWEVVRRDLPMTTKTRYWESPNFGDASRYGTHTHYHTREVYQREFHEPRLYSIVAHTLKVNLAGACVVLLRVKQELSRAAAGFEGELLLMLNLLQEHCGAAGVVSSETSTADYIKTITLDWEVFPPGNATEVVERLTRGGTTHAELRSKIDERVRLFSKLSPAAFLKGSGGFGSYIGAKFADDLVVFENVQYGNALYVLYDQWENVSKRSRLELLKETDAKFDRLPHRIGWDEAFEKLLRSEKKKRGLK
ncbi:hypothetical protein SAMN05216573_12257 [Bradyrhizobium sp. Rc3b]|uniref:hypothetical protein n=1 Tax=Bradyrhizobium sp. Rc3b TaxID=1855322 RepID=UPI0008EEA333|nr:hypothetical protein [Bradyrhizobium sp. Rc3b]SFN80838.1 hypothetical protein SAMN05216573_12257 [Bradyrhizobium sp. Rc3b]